MPSEGLPTIPASPNPTEEVVNDDDDDRSYSGSDGDDGDDEFERAPPRKHPHNEEATAQQQQQQQLPPGAYDPQYWGQGSSWYFQPTQGTAMGSQYGSQLQGGQFAHPPGLMAPLPPHLAYYGNNPGYGQAAMGGGDYNYNNPNGNNNHNASVPDLTHLLPPDESFEVYNSRWIMLFYMSLLNLLSDWTCFSVAPIAMLTQKTFGDVDPESLVTVFLGANAMASAMEPAILGRLGLRRTVVFGAMLLMVGSIIKSGGFASILMKEHAEHQSPEDMDAILQEQEADETWRLYLGFFLVGLSQPLYQCTPALLSASWFPENERTMATGVALNSNQLGIGCAFVFGTMMVETEEDILPYFGLLSIIATITFVGAALQFDDAPPTPPSDTARVIKGDLEIKLPKLTSVIHRLSGGNRKDDEAKAKAVAEERKRKAAAEPKEESVEVTLAGIHDVEKDLHSPLVGAPSPASTDEPVDDGKPKGGEQHQQQQQQQQQPPPIQAQANHPFQTHAPPMGQPMPPYPNPYGMLPPPGYYPYPPQQPPGLHSNSVAPSFSHGYDQQGHYHNALLDEVEEYNEYATFGGDDEGAEPVMTQLDNQLDIDVRDDQLVQQFKACFRRPGFSHCIVAFTTAGIIVNTLSTFMDYLVTLNGAGREYVGIVGGTFQLLIMCASLVFGGWTDHSRKYYFVILAMLIFGAFALAVCNVNLDSDAGGDLRFNLLIVAVLAGPLQPLSTELGVEVVYPLSENTVLVIQQLFSNLLSAAFIPIFKALRDVGTEQDESEIKSMFEVPQFTFSFYLLIIIHAFSTCYFATFNGKYLRHEAELDKKAKKEEKKELLLEELHKQHGVGGYGSMVVEPN